MRVVKLSVSSCIRLTKLFKNSSFYGGFAGALLAPALLIFALCISQVSAQSKKTRPARPSKTPATNANTNGADNRVKLIDEVGLKSLLEPKGKPVLINFWATWCDPCREEFPDLVKIDNDYKDRITFYAISIDDPEDINTKVPQFLNSMKANMPAFLLKTADESAAITSISPLWNGGMPFTALYDTSGKLVYFREGKIVPESLREELDKVLAGTNK